MGLMDKAKKGFDSVMSKTNDAIDVSSLRSKIGEENRNIEAKKLEIGEKYWEMHSADKKIDEEFEPMFSSIDESQKRIAEYEDKIAEIKKDDKKSDSKEDKDKTPT